MNEKELRRWYAKNGMEYLAEDWGPRAENGESASIQTQEPERIGREWVALLDPEVLTELEGIGRGEVRPVFTDNRDLRDQASIEALEDFFETHLPVARGGRQEVLDLFLYDRLTLGEVALSRGVSKQAVAQQRMRVFKWVMRELAAQWPDPEGTTEQRAWAVFVTYWRDRFGVEYPEVA